MHVAGRTSRMTIGVAIGCSTASVLFVLVWNAGAMLESLERSGQMPLAIFALA